jgi:hypothetical protein
MRINRKLVAASILKLYAVFHFRYCVAGDWMAEQLKKCE